VLIDLFKKYHQERKEIGMERKLLAINVEIGAPKVII